MLRKIAVAFVAIFLLAGCSSSAGRYGDNNKHMVQFDREVGSKVHFAFNSANLSADAQKTLKRQAAWLEEHKLFAIMVEGHCDERGTREYNIALGMKRANKVKNFLVKNGVDAGRIDTISYGKERPAVIGNDERAWKLNRRAVTVIK